MADERNTARRDSSPDLVTLVGGLAAVTVAGALLFAVYLGAAEASEAFGINKSFLVLFMIIIGGLGSIFGSFAGAAYVFSLIFLPAQLVPKSEILLVSTLKARSAVGEPVASPQQHPVCARRRRHGGP